MIKKIFKSQSLAIGLAMFSMFFDVLDNHNYACLVRMFKESVSEVKLQQQSCYTWSKDGLQSIGAKMEVWDTPPAKIAITQEVISITRLVTRFDANENKGEVIPLDCSSCSLDDRKMEKAPYRVVSYEIDRDQRTETLKKILGTVMKLKTSMVGTAVSAVGIATGFSCGVAVGCVIVAPVALPIFAGIGLIGGAVLIGKSLSTLMDSSKKLETIHSNAVLQAGLASQELPVFHTEFGKLESKINWINTKRESIATMIKGFVGKFENLSKIDYKIKLD